MKSQTLKLTAKLLAGVIFIGNMAYAQQVVDPSILDKCVKDEQITGAAKGVAIGALAGLGASLFSGNSDKAVKAAAAGALVGGAAGWIKAANSANKKCRDNHPELVSQMTVENANKDIGRIKKETNYSPKQGILVAVKSVIPNSKTMKAGELAEYKSTFSLLTPNGAEADIIFERVLSIIHIDGKKDILEISTINPSETHTYPNGEFIDTTRINLPLKMVVGESIEYVFTAYSKDNQSSAQKQNSIIIIK